MRDERDLREDDAECRGDNELEPAVAEQHEGDRARRERNQQRGADGYVELRRPSKEPGLANHLRNLGVRTGEVRIRV